MTFEGVSEGETTLTIGTGADANGIIVLPESVEQATNASVLVTVPEADGMASLAAGCVLLAGLALRATPEGSGSRSNRFNS